MVWCVVKQSNIVLHLTFILKHSYFNQTERKNFRFQGLSHDLFGFCPKFYFFLRDYKHKTPLIEQLKAGNKQYVHHNYEEINFYVLQMPNFN